MPRLLLISLALLGCLPASIASQTSSSAVTAFTNVTVIPMDRQRSLPDQTVIVRGERIAEIGPASKVAVPEGATRIDGRGKFLMPGVSEMHAHIPGSSAPDTYVDRVLRLFVANGVTTIRSMLGDPKHLVLREQALRGEIVAPTIFTSGPSFSGNTAKAVEPAVKMVQDQKAAGYDLLKIHPGVPREVFDAVAAEADRQRIPFAGHVPAAVGLERALAAKYSSIDHIDGYLEYAVKADAPVDRENPGFFGANWAAHIDPARMKQAVAETKKAGVWIVPTQGLMEIFFSPDSAEQMRSWPGVEFMPPQVVAGWVKQREGFMKQQLPERAVTDRFLQERRTLLKALSDGGVDLLLGSDAVQTFSVPGYSIINEMGAMARSGLTPFQIYTSGTTNVARYFGREKEVGTVEVGKIADLVLVDADPMADVANFGRQTGTMVRGRWHPRAELLKGFQ
jgi:imidazolonepropionase-like amidohydrolase